MTIQTLTIGKREFVVLPKRDYERLAALAAEGADPEAARFNKLLHQWRKNRSEAAQLEQRQEGGGARMSYRIEFTPHARRGFLALDRATQQRIGGRIERLAENPRPA